MMMIQVVEKVKEECENDELMTIGEQICEAFVEQYLPIEVFTNIHLFTFQRVYQSLSKFRDTFAFLIVPNFPL